MDMYTHVCCKCIESNVGATIANPVVTYAAVAVVTGFLTIFFMHRGLVKRLEL